MPFVKLDTGILESTLWIDRAMRDVFITALLMAEPYEVTTPEITYPPDSLEPSQFAVTPGWYGFVEASGQGIVRRALVEYSEGMAALHKLGSPDHESRSPEFEGRRMVRVSGGYIILNYCKYREKDHGAAARMRLYRARKKAQKSETDTALRRTVTYADAYAYAYKKNTRSETELVFDDLWKVWPRHEARTKCLEKFTSLVRSYDSALILSRAKLQVEIWKKEAKEKQFIPMLATWLNQKRFDTEPEFIGGNGNGHRENRFAAVQRAIRETCDELAHGPGAHGEND